MHDTVARKNGLTPFSVYQGHWNATFRDMKAKIIPMCEDQGMAIVPWAALGGGRLLASEQRKQKAQDPKARQTKSVYSQSEYDPKACKVLEKIVDSKGTTLQAIVRITTLREKFKNESYAKV